jgi:LuxR family maltose regulon positive regulatory protein
LMAKIDSVIRHAITAPIFDRTKIHRERLVDDIHSNVPRKLIAIAAPPGYGKTTLLADFTANTELPVCWVRTSEADRDVFRLAEILNASLQKRFRRMRQKIDLENLAGASPEALAGVFATSIDETVGEPFVVIFDDVHHINSSRSAIRFLDSFLEVMPDQITVIASGREVVEVSLASLMAEGNLAGLGPQDLALTESEIIELAESQSGMVITPQTASRILDETRGWITGLLLSGELSGEESPMPILNARPMVYEYLASVVLNRQADDLRRFMLDASVFPVMTVAACDEVLRRDDSHKYLTRLVREGLFVSATNETPRTYEFHPVFREFLVESQAGADRKRLRSLQIRAADYFADNGFPEYALPIYIDAGATRRAAVLAEKWAQEIFWRGRWQTLEEWAGKLSETGEAFPRVHMLLAQAYTDQGKLDQAGESLGRARAALTEKSTKSDRALAEIIRGFIALRQGKWEEVRQAARDGQSILGSRRSRQRSADCQRLEAWALAMMDGDFARSVQLAQQAAGLLNDTRYEYSYAATLLDLANFQLLGGEPDASYASSLQAHEVFMRLGAPFPLAVSYNNLGFIAHLSGRYQQAMELYNSGLKFARQAGSPLDEMNILFGQADLFSDLDLALQAAELYGQGLTIAIQLDDVDQIVYGCLQTSLLHRRKGNLTLAHEWIKRAISLSEGSSLPEQGQIQLASLELASRPDYVHSTAARMAMDSSLEASTKTLAYLLIAQASFLRGEFDSAIDEFEAALVYSSTNGTEQYLAGELAFDPKMREFLRSRFGGTPVFAIIMRRIETMRVIAQQYQELDEEGDTAEKLYFFALGRSTIRSVEEEDYDLRPLPRELLFYLLDHQRIERDVLLDTFWPHYAPGRQVANLHTAIYSLRRTLGRDAILHEGSVYILSPELSLDYDVHRFERAAEVADGLPPGDPRRMFALTEAINSYSGPFLPEFTSEWVVQRRRGLELLYLDLLALHATEALVRDQPDRAIKTLRRALAIDPYRDDTNLQLLEALGRLGRRSEIVDHYQRYVRLLSHELGLDPSDAVRNLYTRLIS